LVLDSPSEVLSIDGRGSLASPCSFDLNQLGGVMNQLGQNLYRHNTGKNQAAPDAAASGRPGRGRRARRRVSALGASVALLGAALWVTPPAAVGETVAVVCTGTNVIQYNPGVTFDERTVQITGEDRATSCVDLTGAQLGLSFVAPFSGEFTTSCAALFTGGTGTQTLKWSTGETSQWEWTMHFSTNLNGQLVSIADGPIVGGRYAGAELRQVVTVTTMDQGACSSEKGLTETGGPSSWTITG
jgi:hypothetical protein